MGGGNRRPQRYGSLRSVSVRNRCEDRAIDARDVGPPAPPPVAAAVPSRVGRRRPRRPPRGRRRGRSAATSTGCAASAIRSPRRRGVAGGYRLGAGASLPPLLLDEEEAVAVAVGLRAAANAGVTGIEETSVRALAKLEQVLPDAAAPPRERAALGHGAVRVHRSERRPGHARRDRGRLPRPRAAALRLSRPRRHPRAPPRRAACLVHTGRRWYLVAWDTGRDGLAHVPRRPHRGGAGDRPPLHPARAAGGGPRRVRVARHRPDPGPLAGAGRPPRAARRARARVPPAVGTLEPIDEQSCLLLHRVGLARRPGRLRRRDRRRVRGPRPAGVRRAGPRPADRSAARRFARAAQADSSTDQVP